MIWPSQCRRLLTKEKRKWLKDAPTRSWRHPLKRFSIASPKRKISARECSQAQGKGQKARDRGQLPEDNQLSVVNNIESTSFAHFIQLGQLLRHTSTISKEQSNWAIPCTWPGAARCAASSFCSALRDRHSWIRWPTLAQDCGSKNYDLALIIVEICRNTLFWHR